VLLEHRKREVQGAVVVDYEAGVGKLPDLRLVAER